MAAIPTSSFANLFLLSCAVSDHSAQYIGALSHACSCRIFVVIVGCGRRTVIHDS